MPEPLPPQENWQHPILSDRYAGTMHEDSFASDVSHFPGPVPANTQVGYFHLGEKSGLAEQIQNSFSVGSDGVYIVSNMALYKLHFDAETKKIELDANWKETYPQGGLVYDNDHKIKPGHLNDGSGTKPTLIGDRFAAIVDNGPEYVHLNVFRQHDGTLVSKLPLFEPGKGAVENSVVAYKDQLIVGNTYGYVDPFKENATAGGLMRFDYDETADA